MGLVIPNFGIHMFVSNNGNFNSTPSISLHRLQQHQHQQQQQHTCNWHCSNATMIHILSLNIPNRRNFYWITVLSSKHCSLHPWFFFFHNKMERKKRWILFSFYHINATRNRKFSFNLFFVRVFCSSNHKLVWVHSMHGMHVFDDVQRFVNGCRFF